MIAEYSAAIWLKQPLHPWNDSVKFWTVWPWTSGANHNLQQCLAMHRKKNCRTYILSPSIICESILTRKHTVQTRRIFAQVPLASLPIIVCLQCALQIAKFCYTSLQEATNCRGDLWQQAGEYNSWRQPAVCGNTCHTIKHIIYGIVRKCFP